MLEHPEVPEESEALQNAHHGHQSIEECRPEVGVLGSIRVHNNAFQRSVNSVSSTFRYGCEEEDEGFGRERHHHQHEEGQGQGVG